MAARKILALMIAAATVIALLLIYNSYYDPASQSGVGLPAVTDQVQ